MSLRLLSVVAIATILAGCGPIDTMKEGYAHSQAVSAELEKSLGVKSFVGFNWTNGTLALVNVTFEGIPAKLTLADIAARSKQVVAAEFKQTPHKLVVAFAIDP